MFRPLVVIERMDRPEASRVEGALGIRRYPPNRRPRRALIPDTVGERLMTLRIEQHDWRG